ncbi:hypothetical protein WICMUC_003067 [Wickerhamomyces mucosus]|uniref:HTH TFE/IIEalpha-type domain-containing protein n=1 Tax=Wickerhamomyces mucosus TaxID=1378264 RepID=A0A9P8PPB6_9ASCO|nr:hypothetical protein WICMUC_003067 [Wickerhamomyces mucosus]
MDNTVRSLIRFVVRGFYGIPYVLIIDAVLLHSVLSEEDLSHLLGIQKKELRALCQKLVDDRLLTVHTQKEPGPQMRPVSKIYYFIYFTEAIDSIKWKVHSVVQSIKKDVSTDGNPQGYICPICKTRYSQLDAIALLNYEKNEFICSLCNVSLIEDDSGKIAKENQDKYEKLMKQLEPVINYLRKIDERPIAENNFETSLGKVIPAQANTTAAYSVSAIGKGSKMFSKDSYLNNISSRKAGSKSHATLHVNITANDDNLARERQALELEEKRKQNAMPTWHEQSTVGSAQLGILNREEDEDGDIELQDGEVKKEETENDKQSSIPSSEFATESDIKTEPDTSKNGKESTEPVESIGIDDEDKEAQDALAAYYEQLAQREKEEADEEDEEEEEEDDDEEDEEVEKEDEDEDFDDIELKDIETQPVQNEIKPEDLVVEEDFADSDEE